MVCWVKLNSNCFSTDMGMAVLTLCSCWHVKPLCEQAGEAKDWHGIHGFAGVAECKEQARGAEEIAVT